MTCPRDKGRQSPLVVAHGPFPLFGGNSERAGACLRTAGEESGPPRGLSRVKKPLGGVSGVHLGLVHRPL